MLLAMKDDESFNLLGVDLFSPQAQMTQPGR
jgi:hypothetical protein